MRTAGGDGGLESCTGNAKTVRYCCVFAIFSVVASIRYALLLLHVRAPLLLLWRDRVRWEGERAHAQALLLLLFQLIAKKCYNSQTKKTKLNSDCTIKIVSINTLKQDVT
jgi:hypothetical protein